METDKKTLVVMDKIKIDGKIYEVQSQVNMLITAQFAKIGKLQREIKGYKIMLGKAQAGQPVDMTGEQSMMFAAEKMQMEHEVETRAGMRGWLQRNWGKLCELKCECGDFISFDVAREVNELMCDRCAGRLTNK